MANNSNLISLANRTTIEQREIARMGGLVSASHRKKRKEIENIVKTISTMPALEMLPSLEKKMGYWDGLCGLKNPNVLELVIAKIAYKALQGDLRASKLFLELNGAIPKPESVQMIACQTTPDSSKIVYAKGKSQYTD